MARSHAPRGEEGVRGWGRIDKTPGTGVDPSFRLKYFSLAGESEL